MKVLRVFLTVALFSVGIAVASDRGAGLDPDGGRVVHAAATGDKGLGVDPNGGVKTAAADQRVLIDPNGGIRH